ncbi:MAG: Tyrosine recombinase XerD [Syntrophorhabdus sp. PtaU1.Bin002]|nr:MAG: Tyrosine recombinase XerD [Syntrophorhabdus sp. PtaU1.Bin002]
MKNILSKLAEECFQSARITDELCSSTIKKYRYAIRRFEEAEICNNLEDLSNSDFLRFMINMKEKNVSNSSIANMIASVKWVITRLQKRGMIFNRLNLSEIKKPRVGKKETNYLTEEEVRRFVDAIAKDITKNATARNIRFMAFTMFLLQTGARIGEVLSIDITDIDRHNNEVRVIGKGRKPRTLFLRKETLYWIDRYLSSRRDTEPGLFATQDGRSRWKQTDVGRSFRRYKRLSGIKKDFVIHTFRHTFATQYLMKGAGINVVQTALGHSDAVTTLKYYAAAVEKSKVREMINDKHFDFIPKSNIGSVGL